MKKTNNKGFSLVELIIVIAIMAILVGAIAPALIRYIDKSRKSNDVSACKTIKTAIETAMANEDAYEELTKQGATTGVTKILITPNKKLTIATPAGGGTSANASIIAITPASGTATAETVDEIAKNIGDKTPKISYKKKGKTCTVVPANYCAIITAEGTIYVGICGTTVPTAAPTYSGDKMTESGWYPIVPETCADYK